MYAYVCVCACMRVYVHVYMHVYVYMSVCVCVRICICIHTHVSAHMHSCGRILFICTVQSLYYMPVYHRCFLAPACVCGGELEVGSFPACSWLALVASVGGCGLTGVEIGGLF